MTCDHPEEWFFVIAWRAGGVTGPRTMKIMQHLDRNPSFVLAWSTPRGGILRAWTIVKL